MRSKSSTHNADLISKLCRADHADIMIRILIMRSNYKEEV